MEVTHERCCGLDIHKRVAVACLITPGRAGRQEREVRSFSTMTRGLLELADWLQAAGCTHVAMESTGSYWKPIYNLLEGAFSPFSERAAPQGGPWPQNGREGCGVDRRPPAPRVAAT